MNKPNDKKAKKLKELNLRIHWKLKEAEYQKRKQAIAN